MSTETIRKQEIPAATWTADPIHSSVRFEVGHSEISTFRGGFGEFDARLVTGEEPSLSGSVKVESVDIDEPALKGHLLSPDFFDAEKHPEIQFSSRDLRIGEDGEVELSGELSIAGATREVAASGKLAYLAGPDGAGRIGLSLESAVDRTDYGMDWQMELPSGGNALQYEVKILVELEFVEESE